jgi:transposase
MLLPPETQAEVLSLHFGKDMSIRAIARHLGIDRKTVSVIIRRRKVILGIDAKNRSSILDPFKHEILKILETNPNIPSTAIFQKIRVEGYSGSQSNLQVWIARHRLSPHRLREAFLMIEFAPGECAQVDWGEFGNVFNDGIKIHCFVMILCYSRLLYIEFTRSEKFEDFIRCHENGFKYFGGVPKECWYDNLRTAVTDRMGSIVRFNSRFMAYMGHHGIKPHACNPARGNEKGRVEDSVKYIRSSFWSGRSFENFDDLCLKANRWRDDVANKREHRSTRKIPILHFESEEKKALLLMNPHPYEVFEILSRVISSNFHFTYETNRYSVPWTLVGLTVTTKTNHLEVRVYYNEKFITSHIRSYKKNQLFTKPGHMSGLLERKPNGTKENWQLHAVKSLGSNMKQYLDFIRSGQRSLRSEVAKLLALATIYGHDELNETCKEMLDAGIIGTESLEMTLKNKYHPSKRAPNPLNFQSSTLNRVIPTVDLRRFDALLFESTNNETASIKGKEDDESES